MRLGAAVISCLYRRTGDTAVGAVDATIPCLWLEQRAAAFAVVKPLAGIGRHGLDLLVTAVRAG